MKTLEERVAALEIRLDKLAMRTEHTADVSLTAGNHAQEAQQALLKNIALLNALSSTQAVHDNILRHHTDILGEHTIKLDEHSRTLDEHTRILGEHTRKLDEHTRKLDEHTGRFDTLDEQLETITSMLSRMMGDNDSPTS